MRGEVILSTVAIVLLISVMGMFFIKKAHNDTPVQHQLECTQKDIKKPDCKCDVLEAGKVIIK